MYSFFNHCFCSPSEPNVQTGGWCPGGPPTTISPPPPRVRSEAPATFTTSSVMPESWRYPGTCCLRCCGPPPFFVGKTNTSLKQ